MAETSRTFTLRVFDEPSRSNSPVSITRSSFCCWVSGTLAISSRNSVLPSASSKRPTRSALASVNEPLRCPNSSDSNTPSAMPPALTVTIGRLARGRHGVQRLCDQALAASVLTGDQDVGVRRADPRDHLQHRPHRAPTRRESPVPVGLQRLVGGLELPSAAQRPAQLGLGADDREQPLVVPRLLHEVASAAAHRLHRHVHRSPCGHHHDRQRLVGGVNPLQEIEALRSPDVVSRA